MAFNWQTFRTRALTAGVFVAVMLAGLLWNQWSFLALFTVIHFGCWWEYLKLIEKIYKISFHIYVKLGLMVMGYGLMLWFCGPVYHINNFGIKENFSLPVSVAGFALLIIGIFQKNKIQLPPFAAATAGWIYISLSWGFMISLYKAVDIHLHDTLFVLGNNSLPIIIILSIWLNDTLAYLVGSFMGKTPLTKISPKKTWEGTIGGIILCIAVMGYLFPLIFWRSADYVSFVFIGIIAAITAIAGTFGDLFESKLKRMAGVKDSGNIMPGHGGFLDRFDSLLFATPCVWLLIYLIDHS
jgi:phosphatidate cytidylyltransferase